jgi:putative SOS response-associated peptidase YedK
MPTDEAPSDDDPQIRQSYNFAPGYHGLIYRAATNDRGTDATPLEETSNEDEDGEPSRKRAKLSHPSSSASNDNDQVDGRATRETKYKLQSAKWGLIPFWTKRPPEYSSMLRTINCRDDSLAAPSGMWTTMKQRKRCIVVAEGFYEWLKKNNGKERLPHFVKRKDGGVMCFAGLWDCVKYESDGKEDREEGQEGRREGEKDKLYTYAVITTDSNKQLQFLHDRMPVILEPGSEEMRTWLDPTNVGWNRELQSMLKPFQGELEVYPVDKAVGKVGNNSPNFVIPIDSKENKKNIANFFGAQKAKQASSSPTKDSKPDPDIKQEPNETRATTTKVEDPESNAPLPKLESQDEDDLSQAINKDLESVPDTELMKAANEWSDRDIKREEDAIGDEDLLEAEKSPPRHVFSSPSKAKMSPSKPKVEPSTPSKTRSATSNAGVVKTPVKSGGGAEGNKKITAFFGGKV